MIVKFFDELEKVCLDVFELYLLTYVNHVYLIETESF